jgi:hypothetical protein
MSLLFAVRLVRCGAQMYLGRALRLQGKVAEALTLVLQSRTQLESLVTLQHPWAALAFLELGEMYRSGKRYVEAMEVCSVSLKQNCPRVM